MKSRARSTNDDAWFNDGHATVRDLLLVFGDVLFRRLKSSHINHSVDILWVLVTESRFTAFSTIWSFFFFFFEIQFYVLRTSLCYTIRRMCNIYASKGLTLLPVGRN